MAKKSKPRNFLENGLNLPAVEEKVLEFWNKNQIFEKSLEKRNPSVSSGRSRKARSGKTFVFYEGPPYANGKPGIHHVLARVVKDIILRYKSMRGYYVPRKAGWDTHGLPVEIAAEKALGLKSKKDIEKFGIERFNEEAKKAVWLYKDEWERMTKRIGYWLDLKNAYVTYTSDYIETIWWTLKRIWERKLLYKGHKVVPWCTRCGTALSSHELALGYKETTDESIYVKFSIKSKDPDWSATSILSWTTTPWTLPGNVALAVNPKHTFVCIDDPDQKGRYIVLEKSSFERLRGKGALPKDAKAHEDFSAKELLGLAYEPLFRVKPLQSKQSYEVYPADFVTTKDGTGVVHTAVMYGEDDYALGKKIGLPQHHTVSEDGKFTKDVSGLAGSQAKSKETDQKIFAILRKNKNLLKVDPYTHEYPFCWRCGTPVLYYARTSWFIAMSTLRKDLLRANKKINWIPEHVKEGRFGEWLREVKDWNLSRERYWGAPLPIWECKKCGHTEVLGSLDELNEKSGGSHNNYWVMRHGQAANNVTDIIDAGKGKYHLTTIGADQALRSAQNLKKELDRRKEKIDLVVFSDILRTKETAKIVAKALGVKKILVDKRLREIQLGALEGCHDKKYQEIYPTYQSKFETRPEKGESLRDLRARLWKFIEDTEEKYKNKNILIVSHEYPIWMLFHATEGWSEKQAIEEKKKREPDFVSVGEVRKMNVKTVPRNDTGEVDIHRPFTDGIAIPCAKCRAGRDPAERDNKMFRVKEVADVWYDSGAMPFAQQHYPFENKQLIDKGVMYPANYISEGMDQTRGWFYTLLAIATALGYDAPYKNVISLGLINDKFGQKMSKSKGNVVDPWAVIQKYGVDAVRWYFYSATPPGEPKNFDENEVAKAFRRVHLIVYNSLVFYETYADRSAKNVALKNLLDKWIVARLQDTIQDATQSLERYDIRESAIIIERFVDDLSRWYIRRSRRRLQKSENKSDYVAASATLRMVLLELTKLMAPFTPFFAEALYSAFGEGESVHLADWPEAEKKLTDKKLVEAMTEVRKLASDALAKRAEAGIKVRQPLALLTAPEPKIKLSPEIIEILKDEANVKKVLFKKNINTMTLDTKITPELKEEGILREFTRLVQGLRQDAGLKPKDSIAIMIESQGAASKILNRNINLIKKEVGAKTVELKRSTKFDAEVSTDLDSEKVWVGIRKVK